MTKSRRVWKKSAPSKCKTCGRPIIALKSPGGKWAVRDYVEDKIGERHSCRELPRNHSGTVREPAVVVQVATCALCGWLLDPYCCYCRNCGKQIAQK